jgi:hypothetical protein
LLIASAGAVYWKRMFRIVCRLIRLSFIKPLTSPQYLWTMVYCHFRVCLAALTSFSSEDVASSLKTTTGLQAGLYINASCTVYRIER